MRSGKEGEWEINVTAPGELELRYLLLDAATNQTVDSGIAQQDENGLFKVEVTTEVSKDLFPGLYHLHLAASSSELALIAERRVDVEVLP